MKHILQLVVLFCMTTLTLSAQEKKAFTLEDVIPEEVITLTWNARKHTGTWLVG